MRSAMLAVVLWLVACGSGLELEDGGALDTGASPADAALDVELEDAAPDTVAPMEAGLEDATRDAELEDAGAEDGSPSTWDGSLPGFPPPIPPGPSGDSGTPPSTETITVPIGVSLAGDSWCVDLATSPPTLTRVGPGEPCAHDFQIGATGAVRNATADLSSRPFCRIGGETAWDTATYSSVALIPTDYGPCSLRACWTSSDGATNCNANSWWTGLTDLGPSVGIIVRDREVVHHYRMLILDNTGDFSFDLRQID